MMHIKMAKSLHLLAHLVEEVGFDFQSGKKMDLMHFEGTSVTCNIQ